MSTISAGTTSTTTLIATGDTTGSLVFKTNDTGSGGTTAMTIDTSQNVGIGTSSPGAKLDAQGTTPAYFGADPLSGTRIGYAAALPTNTVNCFVGWIPDTVGTSGVNGDLALQPRTSAGANIRFFTGSTSASERARIDSSGNLLVGQTSGGNFCLELGSATTSGVSAARLFGANIGSLSCGKSGGNYAWVGYNLRFTNTTDSYLYNLGDTASGINFKSGGVYTQTAPSGTAGNAISFTSGPYITQGAANWTAGSSDVRVKKNFEPSQGLAEVLQIEPIKYHFNWDSDSSPKRLGFKAQNLQPLIPEMVVEKDELAEDGTPLLTITPDFMLPVLVKAIQELKALNDAQASTITQLTERISALENK